MSQNSLLWMRRFFVRLPADVAFAEAKQTYITTGGVLFVSLLGPLFLLLNLIQGQPGLALINGASSIVGLVCLLLLRLRFPLAAGILLVTGTSALYTTSALLYHNGMEYPLLACMFGAVFMFDSVWLRVTLTGANAAAFMWVKIQHFDFNALFPVGRYAINIVVFLLCYYVIQELLRQAYTNYRVRIEQQNIELADSRRELHEEHERLMARTAELDVANNAKEKLFTIIAHDLRGPFGGLKTVMDKLKSGEFDEDDFKGLLDDLTTNVDFAYQSLDTLLTWSASQLRAIKPVPSDVSLPDAVESCVGLLAPSAAHKGIVLKSVITPGAKVRADANQLLAILRNLLANALKFTPTGGTIEVDAVPEGSFWRITVTDTGVGMLPEEIDALFTTSVGASTRGTDGEQGMGLGLTICSEFVESNGGEIFVESEVNRGSRFCFTLPAAK